MFNISLRFIKCFRSVCLDNRSSLNDDNISSILTPCNNLEAISCLSLLGIRKCISSASCP